MSLVIDKILWPESLLLILVISFHNGAIFHILKFLTVDTEQPVCTPPQDREITLSLGDGGTTVSWTEPRATDNCGIVTLQSRSHAPGDFFPTGQTRVTYTFIDSSQNTVACGFNVIIIEGSCFCFAMCVLYMSMNIFFVDKKVEIRGQEM